MTEKPEGEHHKKTEKKPTTLNAFNNTDLIIEALEKMYGSIKWLERQKKSRNPKVGMDFIPSIAHAKKLHEDTTEEYSEEKEEKKHKALVSFYGPQGDDRYYILGDGRVALSRHHAQSSRSKNELEDYLAKASNLGFEIF